MRTLRSEVNSGIFRGVFRRLAFTFAAILPLFTSGCTSVLWDKGTFARSYQPGEPANVQLYYSKARKDILVRYEELNKSDQTIRPRFYWLEPNADLITEKRKPHFVTGQASAGLDPIRVIAAPLLDMASNSVELYAVVEPTENSFTLYSGKQQINCYPLPNYQGGSQKVKQVLLTPFAVVVDATIVGGVVGYFAAPSALSSLSSLNK